VVVCTGAVLNRIFIFVVSNPSILPIWPAAANNFVVITNGGGARSLEEPISTNSVPPAFFPRVAIRCRLLGGVLIGGYHEMIQRE